MYTVRDGNLDNSLSSLTITKLNYFRLISVVFSYEVHPPIGYEVTVIEDVLAMARGTWKEIQKIHKQYILVNCQLYHKQHITGQDSWLKNWNNIAQSFLVIHTFSPLDKRNQRLRVMYLSGEHYFFHNIFELERNSEEC